MSADPPGGTAKADLRTQLRRRRRAIHAARDAGADSAALARHALALTQSLGLGRGATVAAYTAIRDEPPTSGLIAALTGRGIRVLLPITRDDLDLDWYAASPPDDGSKDDAHESDPAHPRDDGRDAAGVRIPADAAPLGVDAIGEADLVFVPGLAADATGTRLGQGGGSYDRALSRVRPGTPIVVILHPGEVSDTPLPRDPHDVTVTGVLTTERPPRLGPAS